MSKASLSLGILVLFAIFPSTSAGQISQRSFRVRRTIPAVQAVPGAQGVQGVQPPGGPATPTPSEGDCQYVITNKFPKTRPADFEAAALLKLRSCADALDNDIPDPNDVNSSSGVDDALGDLKANYKLSTADQVNEQLITTHYLSRVLRRWANLDSDTAADVLASLDAIDGHL